MLGRLFRTFNRLNPSSHGRHYITGLAKRLNALPKDGEFQVERGVTMKLHMDDFIERSIYFDAYEFLCRKIILSCLKPGSVFIDIGANVGYYSLLANGKVGAAGRVLSFEPNPVTAGQLKRNIRLSAAHQIELFGVALSDKEGEVQLYCPKDETHGHASLQNQRWRDVVSYTVPAKRMDDILPKDIEHIDLVKIDVEGAELLVFAGGGGIISRFKPPIIMELNEKAAASFGYDILDAVKLLMSYNPRYQLKFIAPHKITDTTLDELFEQEMRNGDLLLY